MDVYMKTSLTCSPGECVCVCVNGSFLWPADKLTVDADDFDHGDGEEGQRGHVHLDEDGRQQEDHQDDPQAARDPQLLRNPA